MYELIRFDIFSVKFRTERKNDTHPQDLDHRYKEEN